MGSSFIDESYLQTPSLLKKIEDLCKDTPGFNYGRLDVKTRSSQGLQKGEFTILEVNGITAIPTHIYDPQRTPTEGYKILWEHARYLVQIAVEHKHKNQKTLNRQEIYKKIKSALKKIETQHQTLMQTDI